MYLFETYYAIEERNGVGSIRRYSDNSYVVSFSYDAFDGPGIRYYCTKDEFEPLIIEFIAI